MRSYDFLQKCKYYNMSVFTSAEAKKLLDKSTKYTSLYLSRLARANVIQRIERGKYFISDSDIYTTASNIVFPSYISMLSAFKYYNITSQNIVSIDVATLRRHKEIPNINGYSIQFIKFDKEQMFGYYRVKGTGAFIAYVEKALIDAVLYGMPKPYILEAVSNAAKDNILDYKRFKDFSNLSRKKPNLKWLDKAVNDAVNNIEVMQ